MNYCFQIYPQSECPPVKVQKVQSSQIIDYSPKEQTKDLKSRKNQGKNIKYRWSPAENLRYVKFLVGKGHLFQLSFKQKKRIQINKKLAGIVKTRTPQQCHTHHQKMMAKYGSVENIIEKHQTQSRDQLQRKFYNNKTSKKQGQKQINSLIALELGTINNHIISNNLDKDRQFMENTQWHSFLTI